MTAKIIHQFVVGNREQIGAELRLISIAFTRLNQIHPHLLKQFLGVFARAALARDESKQSPAMARVQQIECAGIARLVAQHEGFIACFIDSGFIDGHVARKCTELPGGG